ncbi:MAG: TIM barrel protein [Methanobacteriota archaeon]
MVRQAKIFLGPAGIPLSCKGRTILDGVRHVQDLGLNAMEVEFVRGIRLEDSYAREVGTLARDLGIRLTAHAPYYTNLGAADEKTVERSVEKVVKSGWAANLMGCDMVVCHPGFYTTLSKKETMNRIVKNVRRVRKIFEEQKIKVALGLEVMGKSQTFGSVEEIFEVCKRVEGAVPVIDFSHVHARTEGGLKTREGFEEILRAFDKLKLKHYHCYFTGNTYANGNEIAHVPIKKGDLDVNLLFEAVLDGGYDVTVISISPIVEHDAMYMKLQLEKILEKRGLPLAKVYKVTKGSEPLREL